MNPARTPVSHPSLEDKFTNAAIDVYERAGKEADYWARRFLQSVRRNGGLATAKRMLHPRRPAQRQGLDALLKAGRRDLTFEHVILKEEFRPLFTPDELKVAADRLQSLPLTLHQRFGRKEAFGIFGIKYNSQQQHLNLGLSPQLPDGGYFIFVTLNKEDLDPAHDYDDQIFADSFIG